MEKTTKELAEEAGIDLRDGTLGSMDGLETFRRLVIENERECAEAVWSMIEARMTGGVNFVDWQAAQIISLQRRVEELQKRLGETEEHTHAE